MKRQKPRYRINVKLISLIAAILALLFFLLWFGWQVVTGLDYFKVKEVVIVGRAQDINLAYLKGSNIWKVDLDRESRLLSLQYPAYRKVNLYRVLPDRLYVTFQKRKPVALVKLARYFYVDDQQVLFDVALQPGQGDLPVITGLNAKLLAPDSGKRYNVPELNFALTLIREFRRIKALNTLKIRRINIENAGCASRFLSETLEVKIGSDDIADKLNILSSLILQSGRDVLNIKYIDLRFDEPVVKLYNAK